MWRLFSTDRRVASLWEERVVAKDLNTDLATVRAMPNDEFDWVLAFISAENEARRIVGERTK